MLNEEICKLRDKLNKSIENGDDYSITYKLSIELDELIAKYYRDLKNKTCENYCLFFSFFSIDKNLKILYNSTSEKGEKKC